jgi:hypothetical protein
MGFVGNIIRALVRVLGLLFLAAGLAAAGFFVAVVAAGDGRAQQTLGQVWYQHDPFEAILGTQSLPLLGAIIERKLHPAIWNPGVTSILGMPSATALFIMALVLMLIAAALILLTGRRRPAGKAEAPGTAS